MTQEGASFRARDMAESFGSDPERYDRVRPRYPDALVGAVLAASPGRDVLDVGAGTGIVSRQFRAAGCRVLGVDVDERMAEFARRDGLEVEVGTFEEWDPAGRDFDAVVAGQTWHWVDPVAGARKAAEVLRPGGRLAVFWNVFRPAPDLAAAFDAVYRRLLPEPFGSMWERGTDDEPFTGPATLGIREAGLGEPETWRFPWERAYARDEWLEQMRTSGGTSRIPPDTLEELLAASGEVIGDGFTMGYEAVVVTVETSAGSRTPAAG